MNDQFKLNEILKCGCLVCGFQLEAKSNVNQEAMCDQIVIRCKRCGFIMKASPAHFDGLLGAMRPGAKMNVMSVQRTEPVPDVDGGDLAPGTNKAIVTTDGPIEEALVDLDKIAELVPNKSPLGILEDTLTLFLKSIK